MEPTIRSACSPRTVSAWSASSFWCLFCLCLRVSVILPTCSVYPQQKRAYSALYPQAWTCIYKNIQAMSVGTYRVQSPGFPKIVYFLEKKTNCFDCQKWNCESNIWTTAAGPWQWYTDKNKPCVSVHNTFYRNYGIFERKLETAGILERKLNLHGASWDVVIRHSQY